VKLRTQMIAALDLEKVSFCFVGNGRISCLMADGKPVSGWTPPLVVSDVQDVVGATSMGMFGTNLAVPPVHHDEAKTVFFSGGFIPSKLSRDLVEGEQKRFAEFVGDLAALFRTDELIQGNKVKMIEYSSLTLVDSDEKKFSLKCKLNNSTTITAVTTTTTTTTTKTAKQPQMVNPQAVNVQAGGKAANLQIGDVVSLNILAIPWVIQEKYGLTFRILAVEILMTKSQYVEDFDFEIVRRAVGDNLNVVQTTSGQNWFSHGANNSTDNNINNNSQNNDDNDDDNDEDEHQAMAAQATQAAQGKKHPRLIPKSTVVSAKHRKLDNNK
jgi:hypothetical protein